MKLVLLAALVTFSVGAFSNKAMAEPLKKLSADPLMEGRNSTIMGVNHVGMTVKNIERSVEYYEKTVGMKSLGKLSNAVEAGMPNVGNGKDDLGRALTIQGPNSFLRLMAFDHSMPAHRGDLMPVQGAGITHICFQGRTKTPLDGRFIDNGGTWQSSSKAMVDMRGVGYMYGYVRDPDGIMVEIEHAPELMNNGEAWRRTFTGEVWMAHVAIATPDLTKMLDFYEKVLGFPHYRRADDLSGATFDQVAGVKNGKLNGAWFRMSSYYNLEFWQFDRPTSVLEDKPKSINQLGYNMVAFETSDIEADYVRIQEAGVVLETAIVETDTGRAFYLRDPDGNLLSVMQVDAGSPFGLDSLK